ncbi:MAG: PQQ-binding-like beta-propeller repeat protein [Pirellulales bacterium]
MKRSLCAMLPAVALFFSWQVNVYWQVNRCDAEELRPSTAGPVTVSPDDWPWWRGPNRDNVAVATQTPPLRWSEEENIDWKVPLPGRGHGSPTVVGDQVFLATADLDADVQSVQCFDRRTGAQQWHADVHRGGLVVEGNKKASLASSTVASDGERLFINFLNGGAVYTTALDRQGNQLWQTKISDYKVHQGYGSSPLVYDSLVIVSADNKGGGAIVGLDRATGDVVWRHQRPEKPNYPSPIVHRIDGRDQLLMVGCDLVSSFDPLTGRVLWETAGATTECVTTTVTDGELIFTSGGYPKNHMSAVRTDGSGDVVWENNTRIYVPSMLVKDGYLYAVADAGIAACYECGSGEQVWKGRIRGTFSSSPVLVGERIFVTSEEGLTYVFAATPDGFTVEAENQLGDHVMATPVYSHDHIYMRLAHEDDDGRQEMLYCIGE